MKYAVMIARIVLGAVFLVFGLNGLLPKPFIEVPPMPDQANQFMGIMVSSGWLTVVKLLEVIGGLLLLIGRWVPAGLTILGPIIVNILIFHIVLAPDGMPMAIILTLIEIFLIWCYRGSFSAVFQGDAKPEL